MKFAKWVKRLLFFGVVGAGYAFYRRSKSLCLYKKRYLWEFIAPDDRNLYNNLVAELADEERESMDAWVRMLSSPDFAESVPRRAIFSGDRAGWFAKAMAVRAGVRLHLISPTDSPWWWVSLWLARLGAPSIVFLDRMNYDPDWEDSKPLLCDWLERALRAIRPDERVLVIASADVRRYAYPVLYREGLFTRLVLLPPRPELVDDIPEGVHPGDYVAWPTSDMVKKWETHMDTDFYSDRRNERNIKDAKLSSKID